MKIPEKKKVKTQKIKKKPIDKNKKEQVLVVAQEFKFARLLSGNEKKTRDRVLKTLKKWLQNCFDKKYEFKEDDFVRVWKGLFYAVWMSDKPLVQEDLCESIAEILDLFPPDQLKDALMMTKAGFKVLALEWYGIDQHRMDKFFMLIRRYLRGSFRCLLRSNWSLQSCQMYSKMLMDSDGILCVKTPQYAKNSMSLMLHIIDCYLEELAKTSKGELSEESLAVLLAPFTSLVCGGESLVMCAAARRLLTALLRQSEPGLRYQEATRAWQKMGCPAGGPEALELVVSDDEGEPGENGDDTMEEESSALDPRAGRVDVVLPLLPVPATQLAEQLREKMAKASSKAYKRASICLQRFEALSLGKYPLPLPEQDTAGLEPRLPRSAPEQAAQELRALEKSLVTQSDELALRGLKRKHRKRLLAKTRAGLSIMDDVAHLAMASTTNGDWQIEDAAPDAGKKNKQENTSNKENVNKRVNRKRKVKDNVQEKVKKPKPDVKSKVKIDKSKNTSNKAEKLTNGVKKDLVNGHSEKLTKQKVKNAPKLITTEKVTKGLVSNDSVKEITKVKTEIVNTKDKVTKDLVSNDSVKEITKVKTELAVNKNKKINRQKVLPMSKIKNYQKQTSNDKTSPRKKIIDTPKKVKFVLKNNSMQGTVDYYKSVRQSPNIPFDSSKQPSKTNLKPSTPSPINPFFKKKLKMKF
ncbi:uncharacterized protein Nnp-1 [Epargyreus clarus]|uniref:uncharacterized protein Nnp-1 n=1 Tax=Epargyreus clarus TaxID=520877 RepID=UPI003C2BEAD7